MKRTLPAVAAIVVMLSAISCRGQEPIAGDSKIDELQRKVRELLGAQDIAPQVVLENDKELERLQGDWVQIEVISRGKAMPGVILKVTIKGSQLTMPSGTTMTIAVDAGKMPKWLDRKLPDNEAYLGIYKLEGDTLTICSGRASGSRPKDFKPTETNTLQVWKRAG